jgi:hypothetical protein
MLVVHALHVVAFTGEPVARVHTELAWAAPGEWRGYRLLEADEVLLSCLGARWPELVVGVADAR